MKKKAQLVEELQKAKELLTRSEAEALEQVRKDFLSELSEETAEERRRVLARIQLETDCAFVSPFGYSYIENVQFDHKDGADIYWFTYNYKDDKNKLRHSYRVLLAKE